MSTQLTSFAIVGAGTLGVPIVQAFAAINPQPAIVVLTRSPSDKTYPSGVKTAVVDYNDVAAVAAILKEHGVQAVISTVATPAIEVQRKLADAAKQVGVKVFAPSEFGLPTIGVKEGALGQKNDFIGYLSSIGLPSVSFYVGLFIEFLPWLSSFDSAEKKWHIVGKGDTPFSTVAVADIAGFVAHVLTTLPVSQLENTVFRLEGARHTQLELAKIFGASPVHVETITGEAGEFKTFLQKSVEAGIASTGWNPVTKQEATSNHKDSAGSAAKFWPGHQWKSVKEIYNL